MDGENGKRRNEDGENYISLNVDYEIIHRYVVCIKNILNYRNNKINFFHRHDVWKP